MGKKQPQLSARQADVLNWIRDGCPHGVYKDGYEHRIIARALERRGLVSIKGRGTSWTAKITETGLSWSAAPSAESSPAASEADQLIARVLEADGRLILPEDRDVEKVHERLVRMSHKSPNRPNGKRLEMRRTGKWGSGPRELIFVEHFDDYVDTVPVPVPENVTKYHPAVKAFLADKEWQYVTAEHLPRTARILQAIANEARKRGFEVLSVSEAAQEPDRYRSREIAKGHLALKTQAGTYGIQIRELSGSGAKQLERRHWNERKTLPAWIERRGWEFISTGKLELIVFGPRAAYNGGRYRDAKTTTLEEKLPEVFRSFEIYRLQAEHQELERRREEVEKQRLWEVAIEQAKLRYADHARWEHFKERSREWEELVRHRTFLEAARRAVSDLGSPENQELTAQMDYAEHSLDKLDPIKHPELLIPAVPDPRPDDLKPFLQGWSPYRAERQSW